MNTIQLPRVLINQILSHAQCSPGVEICGLIAHQAETNLFHVYPIPNIADDPVRTFEMAPQQQIAALRQMREKAQVLFAIYHSHPQAAPFPSLKDRQLADYPNALYFIISMNTKGILQLRGFCWQNAAFEEIRLRI